MATKHRIGIIGVGAIAGMHAKALGDIEGTELVAACCRSEEKGRQFCQKYGGEWYPTAEALLDGAKPDVVTVCTPSGAHLEPAIAALERGIHVLCEKPIEINLERAQQMIDAERASSATLGGIFPQRFNPVVVAAHDAAKAGRFGKLAVANAYVPWWRDDAYYGPNRWQGTKQLDGGGALINQSIHAIDAMLWLAEAAGAGRAVEVFGYTSLLCHNPEHIEVEDAAAATVRFANGAVGVILGTTAMWPGGAMRFHLGGRDGTIEVHEQELITWAFRDEQPDDEAVKAKFTNKAGKGGGADPMAIDYSNHTRNLADFLSAIEAGKPSSIDAGEAWKALAVIRAIYESAESGKPVTVATIG
ncbi:putative oxidoreductase YcjS [Botrimarina colliarenosi]|uniref:Putative oxidoreductase YcjS n=1 Tax=Botrimarina colliarenosi TaxID=2528001 RepID=A0A5C6A9Q4_9BACT|nr:Gfo/Idh/MocA family oxidoreductase [Botrimarina colliarenosi]TWT96140.1 putative oxidoreductase YcjS [Botrimarina colliarenosi]